MRFQSNEIKRPMTARAYQPKSIQSVLDRPICRASCKRGKCLSWKRSARWTPPVEMEWTGLLFLVTVCLLVNMPACSSAHVPEHQTSMYLLLRRRNEFTSTHPILMALRPASNPEVVQQPLRLRGGAFWLSAVAGPEEYRAFWRTLSTAPAHWIRDRMQKLCPFGAKEANIAAKELAVLMEDSPSGGRLRGGGLAHSGPKPEVASQPSEEDHLQLDTRVPFAQAGDVAVVTGASGFMAGHIIRELTAQGLKVRGTVRNLTDAGKTQHLKELFPELELYEADLLDDGSFLECCKGARFVFHVASPFQYVAEDPERDIVEPAVKGTMNVLRCARLAGGVRRVVLTSSTASVITLNPPSDPSWQWSEDDWNTDTTLEDNPYRYSKTLAEQAAWLWMASCYNSHNYGIAGGFEDAAQVRAALEAGGQRYSVSFDLVVINPSFVTGPSLSARTDGESTKLIKELLEGKYAVNGTKGGVCLGMIDVRDVAAAHVGAVFNSAASGRYLVSSDQGISQLELAGYLAAAPALASHLLHLPTTAESPTTYRPLFNTAKAKRDLGLTTRSISESVSEAARELLARGLVAAA